ncbi:hypothetical protein ACJMK2_027363, partial [Sinanodonta woodiana]
MSPSVVNYFDQYGRPIAAKVIKRKIENPINYLTILVILLSGDIHLNPGPVRHPCTYCYKPVKGNQKALQCDFCDFWTHLKCTELSRGEYTRLSNCDDHFYCFNCSDRLPKFTDSFFIDPFNDRDADSDSDLSISVSTSGESDCDNG